MTRDSERDDPQQAPFRLTAAVPSTRTVSIVTLSCVNNRLFLVPSLSSFFSIDHDDQSSIRQLAHELFGFVSARCITKILVRRGPPKGPYAIGHRIETILQLLPPTCAHVNTNRVKNWVERGNWLLPQPQSGLYAQQQGIQMRAIEAAAFGIACHLSDGSPRKVST